MYDAYREQENNPVKYARGNDIRGLENVLYVCPHCGTEHTMQVREISTIFCTACGYAQTADEYGFLHNTEGLGEELRYVSDWSRRIYSDLRCQVEQGRVTSLSCTAKIHMIDYDKHKFREVGEAAVTLDRDSFTVTGTIHGECVDMKISIGGLPTLPFSPGKYFEIQDGKNIYRCVPDDGKLVMKFINLVKIFYSLSHPAPQKVN